MEDYSGRGGRGGRGHRGGRGGRGGHGGRAGGHGDRDVLISKSMSWILRHGAVQLGLFMRPDGCVKLNDLLETINMKSKS